MTIFEEGLEFSIICVCLFVRFFVCLFIDLLSNGLRTLRKLALNRKYIIYRSKIDLTNPLNYRWMDSLTDSLND